MLSLSFAQLEESSALPAAFLEWLAEGGDDRKALLNALTTGFAAPEILSSGSWPELDQEQLRAWEPEFRDWLDSQAR